MTTGTNSRKQDVRLSNNKQLTLHSGGQRVFSVLQEMVSDTTNSRVVTAVYEEGLKNGRKEVIEQLNRIWRIALEREYGEITDQLILIEKEAKYRSPGRPRLPRF